MTLIDQAQDFVFNLLKDKLSVLYTYHNFNHTLGVVDAVNTLSDSENLNPTDKEMLVIAAWFHDTGYINGCANHEDLSSVIAADFLKEKGKSDDYIKKVTGLIKATMKDSVPQTLLEKIIKDADYYHLFSEDYALACEFLRTEWENTEQKLFTDKDWAIENKDFLVNKHHFYTDYALKNWQPSKEKNINKVQKKIKKIEVEAKEKLEKEIKKREKEEKPERGIDTLFRVTLNNHTRLSGIADSKANILLSVNAIIISIALSTIIPKLDSPKNAHLVIPVFVMLISSVITIIFAILSTRPKVTKGVFTKQDIEDKKVNLLFFGNFYKMPLEDYEWAMNEMMKDREYLYNSMIKDLYFLGLVLEKKYRLLRIAYNLFMIGIVLSVIAFVIAFKMVGV
ncbi:Pycsar system effector family protein [Flavobacterium sp. GT3P67]|uniref:Pycsar system effector family protein n=1 Tax=Flavobacterium sp. GT3P67 TaxID=2541722 RepID=UPI00104676F6|nr:Pycsar system effector family protein [Flavobacterium sp. GT3P67]TDE51043.1 HD domain-containing protein [Flavobacterium sp. GT3P67]